MSSYRVKRTENADDMGLIREMGSEWFEATGMTGEMSWDHMVKQTETLLGIGGYFGLALSGSDEVAGGLIGLASPDPFTGDLGAHELAWYITPEHRRGGAADALLKDFEEWAKQAGCTTCHMVMLESSPGMLEQYFSSRGYEPLERRFRKNL